MNKKMFCMIAVFCVIGLFFMIEKTETQDAKSSTGISHAIGNRLEKMHLTEAVPDVKEADSAAGMLKLDTLRKDVRTAVRSILTAFVVLLFSSILQKTGNRMNRYQSVCMTFLTYFILQLRILHQRDGKKREVLFCTR